MANGGFARPPVCLVVLSFSVRQLAKLGGFSLKAANPAECGTHWVYQEQHKAYVRRLFSKGLSGGS